MVLGICDIAVLALRKEASHRSEMVSQLLFNEIYEIESEQSGWTLIRCLEDDYEGWIPSIQVHPLDEATYLEQKDLPRYIVHRPTIEYKGRLIGLGTMLYECVDGTLPMPSSFNPDLMIKMGMQFLNTPYLWGGRNLFGIDCSGFVQICARAAGLLLPRDASQQIEKGENVYFLPEAQAGDLAFFSNEEGKVIHVGMMLNDSEILHASGRVRIDSIDQTGIFNRERNEHTHKLLAIKRCQEVTK